jgi:AraC-like DNA-binding protein
MSAADGKPEELDLQEIENILFSRPTPDLVRLLSYYRRLARAWNMIQTCYRDTNTQLDQAATFCGVSKNHLNVLLRRMSGFTFHQLLTRYRVLKAIEMIKEKNYSMIEVAFESGFGGVNTLERQFRRLIGLTPTQFKTLCATRRGQVNQ